MSNPVGPMPGGQNLLKFVRFSAAKFRVLRGFELPSMSIMFHLGMAPGGQLSCCRGDLSRLSGAVESIAWRLTKILASQELIAIEEIDEVRLMVALTPRGRSLLFDLTDALQ